MKCVLAIIALLPIELLVHLLDQFLKPSANSIHIGSKTIRRAVNILNGGVFLLSPKFVVFHHMSRKARRVERLRRGADFLDCLWILVDKICQCTATE